MIVPYRKEVGLVQKALPAIAAAMLVGLGYTALASTSVPNLRSGRETLRELDPLLIARYVPSTPKKDKVPAKNAPESEDLTPTTALVEARVNEAMEQLAERFRPSSESISADNTAASEASLQSSGLPTSGIEDRLAALFGSPGENQIATVSPGRRTRIADDRPSLQEIDRTSTPERAGLPDGISDVVGFIPDTDVTLAVRSNVVEATIDVQLHEEESYSQTDFDSFGAWIRDNPSELPRGIKAHLGFDPAFATASLRLDADGEIVELYMMYKEALRELHVVLVEGDNSIYLIDRGFTETSHALREGIVTRADGEIVAVDSQPRAAGSTRATAFYSVFLSWWAETRNSVE